MLILKRTYEENYTKGTINIPDTPSYSLNTLELTYKDNQRNISCIPEKKYVIKCHNSPKFGKCLKIYEPVYGIFWTMTLEEKQSHRRDSKLKEVDDRSDILVHSGNAVKDFSFYNNINNNNKDNNNPSQLITYKCDSKGCLLVGLNLFEIKDINDKKQAYLTDSKKALTLLFNYIKSKDGLMELLITSKRKGLKEKYKEQDEKQEDKKEQIKEETNE